jgi:hypothetical protein
MSLFVVPGVALVAVPVVVLLQLPTLALALALALPDTKGVYPALASVRANCK